MKTIPWMLTAMWLGVSAAACGQAPAGATGICRDGTYSTAASRTDACVGHKGVQSWYAAAAAPAPAAAPVPAGPVAAAAGKRLSPAQAAAQRPQAPGGGKGLVWVNTASNVYHCGDDPYYGRTKAGAYMSEADARAKGAHGVRGANCAGK